MFKRKIITSLVSVLIATSTQNALAQEVTSTAAEQKQLNVTIYNNNIALIKDTRKIQLPTGVSQLAFKDVSASIQPETVILDAPQWQLLEQNFEYDLLTENTLLDKYIGKTVTIERTSDDGKTRIKEKAKVLSNNNGVMLKIGNEIRKLDKNMSIIYDKLPSNLREKPTLTMLIDNMGKTKKAQTVALTYLSHQMNWSADYVANLNDNKTLNLTGWVTLNNNSGTSYQNANLQLVAGEVNRVQPEMQAMAADMMVMSSPRSVRKKMTQESLFEYHLYTLENPTTIKNRQQKQVALLSASNVPYKKQLTTVASDPYGWQNWGDNAEFIDLPVKASIIIDNKESNHLGLPMPAGIVRSYKKDSRGNSQFIGEDRIKHTPENEQIELKLGESFDVTAKRKQVSYSQENYTLPKTVQHAKKNVTEVTATYEVLFKNAKDNAAVVSYSDRFYGNWQLEKQSFKSEKINSTVNRWNINVPAKGETKLTYTVKITY